MDADSELKISVADPEPNPDPILFSDPDPLEQIISGP
jgi:hypothetical protein